jgi:hypothetical protein
MIQGSRWVRSIHAKKTAVKIWRYCPFKSTVYMSCTVQFNNSVPVLDITVLYIPIRKDPEVWPDLGIIIPD